MSFPRSQRKDAGGGIHQPWLHSLLVKPAAVDKHALSALWRVYDTNAVDFPACAPSTTILQIWSARQDSNPHQTG